MAARKQSHLQLCFCRFRGRWQLDGRCVNRHRRPWLAWCSSQIMAVFWCVRRVIIVWISVDAIGRPRRYYVATGQSQVKSTGFSDCSASDAWRAGGSGPTILLLSSFVYEPGGLLFDLVASTHTGQASRLVHISCLPAASCSACHPSDILMTQPPDCVSSNRVLAPKLRKRLPYFLFKFKRKLSKSRLWRWARIFSNLLASCHRLVS